MTAPRAFALQQAELTASDGAGSDLLGYSVAVSGSTAVAGAPNKNSSYVWARSGAVWTQQAKLTASDGASRDLFGISVAVSGSIAVVGAIGNISSPGAAYMWARSGVAWSQQAKLTAFDGAVGDDLGVSVAVSGTTAIAGAQQKNSGTGAADVYQL